MGIGCTTLTSWRLWKFTTDQIPTIPYIACVIILMYRPVTVTARFFYLDLGHRYLPVLKRELVLMYTCVLTTTTYKFFLPGRLILILDIRNQKFEKFEVCVGFHYLIFFFQFPYYSIYIN